MVHGMKFVESLFLTSGSDKWLKRSVEKSTDSFVEKPLQRASRVTKYALGTCGRFEVEEASEECVPRRLCPGSACAESRNIKRRRPPPELMGRALVARCNYGTTHL
jgi:hypothetical protein